MTSQKRSRVLVTGATGFLGRHLISHLCRHSPETQVLALVRDPASWSELGWTKEFEGRIELVQGAVTDPALVNRASAQLRGLTGIYHLAATVKHSRKGADEQYATNVEGTTAMVRLGARLGARVVFVSTSGTVGCFAD